MLHDEEKLMNQKFYIDSFPYEIELTARVCHENARQLLESITDEISIDEFAILDTLTARSGLSQADLARLILKGKAHTGRFLISLEEACTTLIANATFSYTFKFCISLKSWNTIPIFLL